MNRKGRSAEGTSPCIGNCILDEYGFCTGCHRSMAEILAWPQMNARQKREVLDRIAQRTGRGAGHRGSEADTHA